ncbi:MAG: PRC-barrel domain-containing protein [Burkholderiaceae bacterium]|nr:PRC-barrel domain-containing protein [Burkholderiaceae bacterium]
MTTIALLGGLPVSPVSAQTGTPGSAEGPVPDVPVGPFETPRVVAPPTNTEPAIAAYRAYRASLLFDNGLYDRQGDELAHIRDVVVDIVNGDVRGAVLEVGGTFGIGEREVAAPLDVIEGPLAHLVTTLDAEQLRALPDAAPLPAGERSFRARQLIDRTVIGRNGDVVGRLADLVINMNRERVQFAVLEVDPSFSSPQRLLALPIQLFQPAAEEQHALPLGREYLKTRPGLEFGGWSHILQPDQLADLDRQFFIDFPDIWNRSPRTLFEHLDSDQNGRLGRNEAADSNKVSDLWSELDANGDDLVSKPEFVRNYPRPAVANRR